MEHPSRQSIDQAMRALIEKLLKEQLALAAITRVTGISERWLQMYVNQKYDAMPQAVAVTPKKSVS